MGLSKPNNHVFDEIRGKHVPATPEELIRQSLLYIMIYRLHFPKELISIEKQLSELPHLAGQIMKVLRAIKVPQRKPKAQTLRRP